MHPNRREEEIEVCTAGNKSPARTRMTEITTNISIRVNPMAAPSRDAPSTTPNLRSLLSATNTPRILSVIPTTGSLNLSVSGPSVEQQFPAARLAGCF